MNAPLPRGLCPTLAAPMQTGDGLLVRLNPVTSGLSPNVLIGLCEAALGHGNGIVEVTARGNLQIRGLTTHSAVALSRDVDMLGIAVRTGVPIETSPLAGLDPEEIADPTPLTELIRKGVAAERLETQLGPKVSVIVDGGGRPELDEMTVDVRLMAERRNGAVAWQIAVAGNAKTATPLLGGLTEHDACAATLSILGALTALGRKGRARDLSKERLRSAIGIAAEQAPPSVLPDISPSRGEIAFPSGLRQPSTPVIGNRPSGKPISPLEGEMSGRTEGGVVELNLQSRDRSLNAILPLADARFAVSVALPFGHIRADALIDFIRVAQRRGAAEVRLAPQRALLLICPSRTSAEAVRDAAQAAGFITDAADPRRSIAACPGSPACASGHIPARAIAAEIAAAAPEGLGFHLHVSGCAKRCAKPGHDGLTLLGLVDGAALVLEALGDRPIAQVAKDDAAAATGRVAALLRAARQPGQDAIAGVRSIEPARLAAIFRQAS